MPNTDIPTLARKLETQRLLLDTIRMTNTAGLTHAQHQELSVKLHMAEADFLLIYNKLAHAKESYAGSR